MRKQRKLIVISSLLLLAWSLLLPVTSNASELAFSVEAKLPENQRGDNTYFDLNMSPGQKQELTILLKNSTDKAVSVIAEINPATTNVNGVVEYGKSNTTLDETAPEIIQNLVSGEKKVSIPAKGEYQYKLNVVMPEKEFDGILAGGISFKEEEIKKEKETNQGMTIENKFSYALAILLRENETAIKSNLMLSKVEANQLNVRNVIISEVQNPVAKYVNQLKVDAIVTKKGKKEELYKTSKEGLQMAPNTTMHFPLALNGEKLKAGHYTMHILATSGEDSWDLEKDFEITAQKAKLLNDQDVSIVKDNTFLYIIMGLVILLVLVITIFSLILYRSKNKKKKSKRKK